MKVKCPTCQTTVEWNEQAKYRPFCSERCKLIDLGAWASEAYSIPVQENDQWSDSPENSENVLISQYSKGYQSIH